MKLKKNRFFLIKYLYEKMQSFLRPENKELLLKQYCESYNLGVLSYEKFLCLLNKDYIQDIIGQTGNNSSFQHPRQLYQTQGEPDLSLFSKKEGDNIIPAIIQDVEINNQEKYRLHFPYELTNLDYLRRVMDFLQFPVLTFIKYLKRLSHRLNERQLKGECVYYLLKFLIKNIEIWLPLTGLVVSSILPEITYLHEIRNSFSHTRCDVQAPNFKKKFKLGEARNTFKFFETARKFLTILSGIMGPNNIEYSLRNISNLRTQYETHKRWKRERKQKID